MPRFAVILPAAGISTRFGANKLTAPLATVPVITRAILPFLQHPDVDQILIAVPNDPTAIATDASLPPSRANVIWSALSQEQTVKNRLGNQIALVPGGPNRAESVRAALRLVPESIEFVAIHDAARPLVTRDLIDRTLQAAINHGAAAPATPVNLTIKRSATKLPAPVTQTLIRGQLWALQTPQILRRAALARAFETCPLSLDQITDDLQLLELAGQETWLVPGDESNIKITTPQDLLLAELLLRRAKS
jgi:2-C-methyl-D-erythritol 4-phosphate cytidylyltransferase